MNLKSCFMALAIGAFPALASAQVVTHTIFVTVKQDATGSASDCSLREAFDNVIAGAQIGGNSCGAPATQPGTATRIDLSKAGGAILASPIEHWKGEVVLYGGSVNGGDKTRLFEVSQQAHLYLDGVILHNGYAENDNGGAVHVSDDAQLTARRVAFIDNSADLQGGAIWFDSSRGLLLSNVAINYNKAETGAGLYVGHASAVAIDHARFARNLAYQSGSAAVLLDGFSATLLDSRVEENIVSADLATVSAGTFVSAASLRVERSNFEDNHVDAGDPNSIGGGGLTLLTSFSAPPSHVVRDSRFHENAVSDAGGGAIHSTGRLLVDGNTFSGNFGQEGGGAIFSVVAPITLQNSTFLGNDTDGLQGSALIVSSSVDEWQPDPRLPFGGDFRYKVLNNTFADNSGAPQVTVGNSPADKQPILFVNNLLSSQAGAPACSGNTALLMFKRPNDNSPTVKNGQSAGNSCPTIPVFATMLGPVAQGWFYDMDYRKTILANAGDPVVCDAVEVDQFDRKRACLMGAVELEPKTVYTPSQPWWL